MDLTKTFSILFVIFIIIATVVKFVFFRETDQNQQPEVNAETED